MPYIEAPGVSTPTTRRVPEPFLRAEVATFPLASEESFRAGLVELDPQFREGGQTSALWRNCEGRLAPHTGWSLDRLVAARDRGWFGARPDSRRQAIPLHVYLRNLACSHLVRRAGVTEIEESTELTALDAADHYRWLTIALPEDLLLVALGVDPAPVRVDLEPPLLVRRLLDLGVAEIHQHVGGGMDFPLLWASALAAIATSEVQAETLKSPGAPLDEGKNLVRWLLAAAVVRSILAEYLIHGGDSFAAFVDGSLLGLPRAGGTSQSAWTPLRIEILHAVLKAVLMGDDALLPEIEPLRDLYADIHPTALTLKDRPLESVNDAYRRCDPIAVRLGLGGTNAGERWFLARALAHLEHLDDMCAAGQGGDELFTRLFWQTVRVRCQYYRTIVQRPLTGGLQWFIRFYGRLKSLRNPLEPIRLEASYRVAGEGHRIRAMEFRTSPRDNPIAIGEEVLGFLHSWQRVLKDTSGAMFEPEMGVVFHFVKDRDEKAWSRGTPGAFWAETFAEPSREGGVDVAHGRYTDYYVRQCGKARALAEFIEAVPSSLWIIRGLDVANDELGVPTWVLAPLFRHVLDVSARVSIQHGAGPLLSVTAHVGEDFRHLMEGMRRIYEQVHYVLGGNKGRLGHAIALGVAPQMWAESVGSVLMPAEERLWDLVWEWRLYTKYRIKPEYAATAPVGRVEVLLNRVRELSDQVYGSRRVYQVEELAEAHHLLHRFLVPPYASNAVVDGSYSTFLDAARQLVRGGKAGQVHSPHRLGRLLEAYLDDEATFLRGQALIDVPVDGNEVAALDAVQYALRRGIGRHGIVIEVNPSSNLLIGDLLDLRNHPILRLNPPLPEADSPPPVAIALGSDDPVTFSTELLREYTLLYQAACAAGYPERVVQEWLEAIRRTGMDARFTKSWRPSATTKLVKLIQDVSEYLGRSSDTMKCLL